MSDLTTRCLEAFPNWVKTLGTDARALAGLLADEATEASARHVSARALTYIFKSLDLIPDGIEDLGYMDDAFVLRVGATQALERGPREGRAFDVLAPLAADAPLIREFLEEDYARLEAYIEAHLVEARGRSVRAILENRDEREGFIRDVLSWADGYVEPTFKRDPKTLVKLRAFLRTKLQRA